MTVRNAFVSGIAAGGNSRSLSQGSQAIGRSRFLLPVTVTGTVSRFVYDLDGIRRMAIQWTGNGTLVLPINSTARILVVGGGGGGGGNGGGWGGNAGNGGFSERIDQTLVGGATYTINVGGGGGAGDPTGGTGGNSSFTGNGISITCTGGTGSGFNSSGTNGTPGTQTNSSITGTLATYAGGNNSGNFGAGGQGFTSQNSGRTNGAQGVVIALVNI